MYIKKIVLGLSDCCKLIHVYLSRDVKLREAIQLKYDKHRRLLE